MKRVLQVVDNMDMGGVQTFLMNIYRYIDKEQVQFDFLVFKSHEQVYEKEILSLGGKIFKLPGRREGILKNQRGIRRFFEEHPEYDVIHYNTSSLSDIGTLSEAYRRGLPVRIIHSHSTNAPGNKIHAFIHQWHKRKIVRLANRYFACGDLAGKWFYEGTPVADQVTIINNGIDCRAFEFSESTREKTRQALDLTDRFVVGHVGRFAEVKNHRFLLKVFSELARKYPEKNPVLMLVGDGPLFSEMKLLADTLSITNRVLFLGVRQDVPDLLQAMDVMLMPSVYEGFPVTAVEAQAAGLPCLMSDTITEYAAIKENTVFKSLSDSAEDWADTAVALTKRMPDNTALYDAGFDIQTTVSQLMDVYMKRETRK